MRLPSVKTLSAITQYPKSLRALLEKYRAGKCSLLYALEGADELIGGHGVEYIHHVDDTAWRMSGLEYVNMGDTYDQTLIFDHASERFLVGNWGSLVEARPNAYK